MKTFKLLGLPDNSAFLLKRNPKDLGEAFSHLADFIISVEEPKIMYDLLILICPYASGEEIIEIAGKALYLCEKEPYSYKTRKSLILKSLLKCSEETDQINYKGFLKFRLHEYKDLLRELLEKATDEHFSDASYKDFTDALKSFVKTAECRGKEVHVFGCMVFSKEGIDVTLREKDFLPLSPYDRLIATLLSLCPSKIYVHYLPDEKARATVETVFAPNIIYV